MQLILAALSSLVVGHISTSGQMQEVQLADGTYTSHNTQEPAELIIHSGHVVYAMWERVAGCNLDSKRTDCSLVRKSIKSVGPCMLLWQVPFEDSTISAPDNKIILHLENCKAMLEQDEP